MAARVWLVLDLPWSLRPPPLWLSGRGGIPTPRTVGVVAEHGTALGLHHQGIAMQRPALGACGYKTAGRKPKPPRVTMILQYKASLFSREVLLHTQSVSATVRVNVWRSDAICDAQCAPGTAATVG